MRIILESNEKIWRDVSLKLRVKMDEISLKVMSI